jgi:hypothetical protein
LLALRCFAAREIADQAGSRSAVCCRVLAADRRCEAGPACAVSYVKAQRSISSAPATRSSLITTSSPDATSWPNRTSCACPAPGAPSPRPACHHQTPQPNLEPTCRASRHPSRSSPQGCGETFSHQAMLARTRSESAAAKRRHRRPAGERLTSASEPQPEAQPLFAWGTHHGAGPGSNVRLRLAACQATGFQCASPIALSLMVWRVSDAGGERRRLRSQGDGQRQSAWPRVDPPSAGARADRAPPRFREWWAGPR